MLGHPGIRSARSNLLIFLLMHLAQPRGRPQKGASTRSASEKSPRSSTLYLRWRNDYFTSLCTDVAPPRHLRSS
jgi:hypothetical protein